MFIAHQMGMAAGGVPAEPRRAPVNYGRWHLREVVSCEFAWFEAKYLRPYPRFPGKPELMRDQGLG